MYKLWTIFILISSLQISSSQTGPGWCNITTSSSVSYQEDCGSWKTDTCTRYRVVHNTVNLCCDGYSGADCDEFTCDSKTGTDACSLVYADPILIWPNEKTYDSGGTCDAPDTCSGCNEGFYSNGPYCEICGEITKCNHRTCTTLSDTLCKWCDGDIDRRQYYRTYTHEISNGTQCDKVCSWADDSTYCYPGVCGTGTNDLATECVCADNFGSDNCENILNAPNITLNSAVFFNDDETKTAKNDPNEAGSNQTIWTNEADFTRVDLALTATYTPPADTRDADHYVTDFKVGLADMRYTLGLFKGGSFTEKVTECPDANRDTAPNNVECSETVSLIDWLPLEHNVRIVYTVSATNGGYVDVENRGSYPTVVTTDKKYYNGKEITRSFTFHWDLESPYHCSDIEATGTSTCPYPVELATDDITSNPDVVFVFGGWLDDLSGINDFTFQVFEVKTKDNIKLTDGETAASIEDEVINNTTGRFKLTKPGVYSIHLSAFDNTNNAENVGNSRTARTLLFFDDESAVDIQDANPMECSQASKNSSFKWVVQDTSTVTITWTDHFINTRHETNKWLAIIEPYTASTVYEEFDGDRTTAAIDNTQGIVQFEVGYDVFSPNLSDSQNLTIMPDKHVQSEVLNVVWNDGDKLILTVKATDLIGSSNNDTIIIYRDTTPPFIDDLWLTRGDRLNVSVHYLKELTEMTIEWIAYDYHSGVDSLYWRIFDNYTGTDILHGHENLGTQQAAEHNIADLVSVHCQNRYTDGQKNLGTQHLIVRQKNVKIYYMGMKNLGTQQDSLYVDNQGLKQIYYMRQSVYKQHATVSMIIHLKTDILVRHESNNTTCCYILHGHENLGTQHAADEAACQTTYGTNPRGANCYCTNFEGCYHRHFQVVPAVKTSEGLYTGKDIGDHDIDYYIEISVTNHAQLVTVLRKKITIDITPPHTGMVHDGMRGSPEADYQQGTTLTAYWDQFFDKESGVLFYQYIPGTSCAVKADFDLNHTHADLVETYETFATYTAPGIGTYFFTVVAYNRALDHSDPVCSDGVTIDTTVPTIKEVTVNNTIVKGGLVTDVAKTNYWILSSDRTLRLIANPTTECSTKATEKTDLDLYPVQRYENESAVEVDGNVFCENSTGAPTSSGLSMFTSNMFSVSWIVDDLPAKIYDYEVGLSSTAGSTAPDLMNFITTNQNPHIRIQHADIPDGTEFYIIIKGISGSNVEGLVSIGPCFMDTTPPDFSGTITLSLSDQYLVAEWTSGAFSDSEEPFDINYEFAIGDTALGTQIQPYMSLSAGGTCTDIVTPTCTAVMVTTLGWSLHGNHRYYVSIKVTNTAGLVKIKSSGPYIHNVQLPAEGVVFDIEPDRDYVVSDPLPLQDIQDVDFHTDLSTLAARWSGFDHPHLTVTYTISIGTTKGGNDVINSENVGTSTYHKQSGLSLITFKIYYFTVTAVTSVGSTSVSSDGVTIVQEYETLSGIEIYDGVPCNLSSETFSHHEHDHRVPCEDDIDVQSSTNTLSAYWTIPSLVQLYTPDAYFKVEQRSQVSGEMDFSKCKRFSIRGFNRVKMYSLVSTEIKQCDAFNPKLIVPNIVIDVKGAPDSEDGVGNEIVLVKNALWTIPDVDYTPYKNIISAVWPTLRHRDYKYAILDGQSVDVATYYKQTGTLSLDDPCSHAHKIRCGTTENEFMNEVFSAGDLVHGTRYIVCVHADYKEIDRGTWTEVLPAVSTCSDGVVVDLTSPTAGAVWISHSPSVRYQSSITEMYVNWESFVDVDEFGTGPNPTGIMDYTVGIGTSEGANDVVAWQSVGVVNHKAFHGLRLQNGFVYYATVTATDFAGRSTTKTSNPVIVDYTQPTKSDEPIYLVGRHITSTQEVHPCWTSVFEDIESGINHYEWYIGSQPGYYDIMSRATVTGEECGQSNTPLDLLDGHSYYITVEAFNNAGLSSVATSWAFVVDTTPPIGGHVYDGQRSQMTGDLKDIDYQTETKMLYAYWQGFHDSHSYIQEYYVSVGTCNLCDDVFSRQALGIVQDFELTNIHLGIGIKYYVSITACNTAELCTSMSSDGVIIDNSPPTAGSVQDGTGYHDIQYQSLRSYISAKWYGFQDPQSGIEKYVWRAGTTNDGDDVMAPVELHITQVAAVPNLSPLLPVGKTIYITVRAYNRAGLWSEASSNGFKVDDTSPVVTGPTFPENFGVNGLTQIYRTTMKVEWTAEDTESHIERQYLSVKSHIGGQFELSSVHVNGIVRNYIFTNLRLHDGVTYYVTLIACNGAQLCTTSVSNGMFVDTTPPSRGMFAVNTEHAANLTRHEDGHMTWSSRALYLAWLGFSDIHSGIDYYHVTVGSGYLKDDLTDDTSTKYGYTTTGTDHSDEGYIQLNTVPTLNLILYDTVYVTVWAVNGVGLRSAMIHSAFNKIAGGSLELVRRCVTFSCIGHCVCAPQDQKCPYNPSLTCNSVTDSNPNDLIVVYDVNGYSLVDQEITSSDTVLRGYWQFIMRQGIAPQWFEWSVGYSSGNSPDGIYSSAEDRVWHDAAQLTSATYSSEYEFYLTNGQDYSFFVRLWYDGTTFADFKTNGIMISTGNLALATAGGKAVTEKVTGTNIKDADFVRQGRPMTFDWDEKFVNAATLIKEFRIYISTFPGGHDFLILSDTLSGKTTHYNMTRLNYEVGVTYYVNVVAYSYSGVHMTATSDGFTIDHIKPTAGMVYNGIGLEDMEYQNSSSFAGAHWHGFSDTEAGIKEYYWCVGTTTTSTECDLKPWENVGLHVSASRYLDTNATQGSKMYHKVYAIDAVGLISDKIVSDGVVIDVTGPVPESLIHLDANIVENPSFEVTKGSIISWETLSTTTDICTYKQTFHHPESWTGGTGTCLTAVSSTSNLAHDGNFFLYLRGELQQTLTTVEAGKLYRVMFYTSHLPIWEAYVANKEGFVKLGNEYHVFLIYTKSYRKDDHGSSTRELTSWHRHTFYFTASANSAQLTIGSLDMKTGLFYDNIQVHEVQLDSASSGHVNGHIDYIHQWSSIHGSWSFIDPESPIVDYKWAIGYTQGGTQIQTFKCEGRRKFGLNNKVNLVDKTFVYITVIATNAAGLQTIAYSDPVLVDLTPPIFEYVYDGTGPDQDAWEINIVSANWEVADAESGIDFCQYAFGYQPGGSDLHPWTTTTAKSVSMEFDYSDLEGLTVYTSVKCQNMMGLANTTSSDGVRISNKSPSITSAVVSPFYLSSSEYISKDGFQSVTDVVRLKWQGFTDSIGIDNYLITFEGSQTKKEKVSFPIKQDIFFTYFYNLQLTESHQNVHVQAINVLYKKSVKVSRNMTVLLTPPVRDNSKHVNIEWHGNKFDVSWENVFLSAETLWYEISAGTFRGGSNIVQWLETTNQHIEFGMPSSITEPAGIYVFVLVRAVTVSGLYTDADANIQLPT
ncbi:unnamed protein product [Mytilus coruscus]|uniref:Fibronectin type-III domain-containing protein n=1 Tax=Mytilus coruscus TaxID=42192 RepID=A0A6J8E0T8_MYTCO|nr:unnamed protein product [Mytilus coruscus]